MSQPTPNPALKAQFAQAREQFPHTKKMVYLNCAAMSPFSTSLEKSLSQYVSRCLSDGWDAIDNMSEKMEELRRLFASLTGASQAEIGLSSQTTFGLNLAAFGLPLERGDEILLNDKEFPASVYTWQTAARVRGLKIKFVKSIDNRFNLDQFERSISERTKVLCLSWVQFYNGYKSDLKALGEICRTHGLYFVVDGIQGMGVEPINLGQLNVDIFTAGSQKWLMSAQGGGFFYIRRSLQEKIIPPHGSWMNVDWQDTYTDLFQYDKPLFKSARQFENGYFNVLNIVSLLPPLRLISDLGLKQIQEHNYQLIDRLAEFIDSSDKYRITSSMETKHRSSMFTFTCDNLTEVFNELTSEKIAVACREDSIRVSVHCYNNEDDIKRLIEVLDRQSGSK